MKNIFKKSINQIFTPSDTQVIVQEAQKQIIRHLDAPIAPSLLAARADAGRHGDADRLRYQ
ncbi:Uncharacterised protein [Ewingella americana]|uniref:Uncharacterized protein n=1 Tax=Ewingella americana TaxID=41202 RepID=A0A377N8A5_9GAMM|nr:Uncharacterised protein [Ewingella americana]